MKRTALGILVFTMGMVCLYASRPSVQVSNFIITSKDCNSITLQWTHGDGKARIIVAKEGGSTDWTPPDNGIYPGNSTFGFSAAYNTNNYVVYNANGTNFVKVINLQPGHKYCFAAYEHDNNGAATEYLTSNAPVVCDSTYYINFNYTIKYHDSCQIRNSYTFKNESYSNIPNLKYTFHFDQTQPGDSSMSSPVTHSYYTNFGLISSYISANTNKSGCVNTYYRPVKVYQKVVATMDWPNYHDTDQCLDGNLFYFKTKPLVNPLSGSYGYRWFTEYDTTTFNFFKKQMPVEGRHKVSVEITTNISKGADQYPTNCKDTLFFYVNVKPNPVGHISVKGNDTFQCFKYNKFFFNNPDTTIVSYKWLFGDTDSSTLQNPVHSYKDTGTYYVIHKAVSKTGCTGQTKMTVRVLPNLDTKFTGIDTFYCSNTKPVKISPNTRGGTFKPYPNIRGDSVLIPDIPGNYTLSYLLQSAYCKDTSVFNFRIQKTPKPRIGNDTAICSTSSMNISANEPGADQYLWNSGETTEVKSVTKTGKYYVDVTIGKCSSSDSINILYTTAPKVKLGSDTILCKGATMKLSAYSPNSTYLWNTGSTDDYIYVFQPGLYTVTVTNPCGTTTQSIYVSYQTDYCDLFMATAFSPGNDLVNGVFMPLGRNIDVELFQIFNRWGELVFQTDQNNVGWDGTYKGEYVQEGLYIWKLYYTTPNGPFLKKSNAFGQILLLR